MNDRERCRKADDLALLAAAIGSTLTQRDTEGRTVIDRIRDAMAGQPGAQALQSDRTTGFTTVSDEDGFPVPSVSDPTGEAAIRFDRARHDLRQLDRLLQQAHRAVDDIRRLVHTYTPRPATECERRQVEQDNDPGCQSCSRTEVTRGVARWEPVWKANRNPGGVLTNPLDLCAWCYRWVETVGRLPTPDELALHHSGKRVKRPA